MRIGLPEPWLAGSLRLVRILAFANRNDDGTTTFKIYRDPSDTDASEAVELGYTRTVPDNSITELYDFHERPPVEQGPLLVEISVSGGTPSLANGAWVIVQAENADV